MTYPCVGVGDPGEGEPSRVSRIRSTRRHRRSSGHKQRLVFPFYCVCVFARTRGTQDGAHKGTAL